MSGDTRPWRKWYSLARWKRRREVQLCAEPLCQMCLKSETITPADTVDHVTPHRGDYDLFWYGAVQSLCASCHSRHKQLEEHGKKVLRFDATGWPID